MREHAKKRRFGLAALGLMATTAVVLTGCAGATPEPGGDEPKELTKVTLTTNYLAGGPNSGFMLADELGYYEEVGLDVDIQEGQGSATTASVVAQGNSEFGYADGPAAMQVMAQGGDLIIIAPVLQTNGFSIMSLEENGITDVSDLVGKSVGVQPGTAQSNLFNAVLAANDVDPASVEIVNIDPSALVGSLLEGRVDAITAGADSQGVQLRDQGATINEILYKDAGVPTVGLSMIVQRSWAEENPEIVEAFVAASLKGWDAARDDPEAAAAATLAAFPAAGTEEAFVKQLNVDIPLLCSPGAESLGLFPADNWDITFDLLVQYLELPDAQPISDYYTEDYLPEELPAC
ncbi:MAG: ABC transporter substrate-binding protein [Actinomycetota bacterium]|nr:ABC transporter substrate-binding protein [Actinomycetota bacterium]